MPLSAAGAERRRDGATRLEEIHARLQELSSQEISVDVVVAHVASTRSATSPRKRDGMAGART